MNELSKALNGWQPRGGFESYRLYHLAQESNFAVLPVIGGWLDQPEWWLDDIEYLMMLEEYHTLNSKLVTIPAGIPSIEDT